MLEARALRKTFAQTVALDGVSLEIGAGEIVAITGPSGSGKSTLLHCLAGIIRPESGDVLFDGNRIDTLGEAERTDLRRRSFGVVFQFGQLVPELTAAENVALVAGTADATKRTAPVVAKGDECHRISLSAVMLAALSLY
ncbi:ATP-binding cassette domain-containing protein [Nonomuraea sp. NEAU-A123]|uniref:ATP-binding cassette domain-containing protein n=1 Tax=Nonomuraea sp. NEAU-A123 TaxID=2839649 RepID=UPI001BE4C4C8|nr:ATP-binding cassette domain-containing protein [Nonomuraea sp. NEAU-A123]MBT2232692.1 ATP-binding cassette domain-containing protein [Nonomuraea sp. NEAU-A123]